VASLPQFQVGDGEVDPFCARCNWRHQRQSLWASGRESEGVSDPSAAAPGWERAGGPPFGNGFPFPFRNCGCPVRESLPAVEILKETRQSLQRV
jgi:hypothetical protein